MAEKEQFETEFQERYEFVETIGQILEELQCSMYDFRERVEGLHKSIYIAESESFPCLSASVDKSLADNRVNDIDDVDSNHCQIMAQAIEQWPMHKLKSFFTEKSSHWLNILAKKYNDVIERKQKYAANLYVMYNSYKRALNRVHQNNQQLKKMVQMHNDHPGPIRLVRKELEKSQSEANEMHTKLHRYIRHKESADSKLFRRMQKLEDQMDKIEDMRSKHVKHIVNVTVKNYAEIFKNGTQQQQQRTVIQSLQKKVNTIDPEGQSNKWFNTFIAISKDKDTQMEVITSLNPDVSQTTSTDQHKADDVYSDDEEPKVDEKCTNNKDNNIGKDTEIKQDYNVDIDGDAAQGVDISIECEVKKVAKVTRGLKFKSCWIKSVKDSKASAIKQRNVVGENTVLADKLQDAASKECTNNTDNDISKETEIDQESNVSSEDKTDHESDVSSEANDDQDVDIKVVQVSPYRWRVIKSIKHSQASENERNNAFGESTMVAEKLQDAASKECTISTDNDISKETEINQESNVSSEDNTDQESDVSSEANDDQDVDIKVVQVSPYRWNVIKSENGQKNAAGESTETVEKLEDAASKQCTNNTDNDISKVTDIQQQSNSDTETNADQKIYFSTQCGVNKIVKVDKGSKYKWCRIKSVKHLSSASEIDRKNASGESTMVAEKLQDAASNECTINTDNDISKETEINQESNVSSEDNTDQESNVSSEANDDQDVDIKVEKVSPFKWHVIKSIRHSQASESERKNAAGESTETVEKLEDAPSKECTNNTDNDISKVTDIHQEFNGDSEVNTDQEVDIELKKYSKFKWCCIKSIKHWKASAIGRKNAAGKSTVVAEKHQDAPSKEFTNDADSNIGKHTEIVLDYNGHSEANEIVHDYNGHSEANADQDVDFSTVCKINKIFKFDKGSIFKWRWIKSGKYSKTSAIERKNASAESTVVAEKLQDAPSKECTINTDNDISKVTDIHQESNVNSEDNTDQEVDIKVERCAKFKWHWTKSVKNSKALTIERKNASGESGEAEKLQNAPSKEEDINAITQTTSSTHDYSSANDSIDGHGDDKPLKNTLISVAAHTDTADFDDDFVASSAAELSHLKVRARVSYEKTDKSQISLRPGMILKQKTPQNEDGMCFGYKQNKFGRKRYGWYPARFVEQIPANQ